MKKTAAVLTALALFASENVFAADIITSIMPSNTVSVYELGESVDLKLKYVTADSDRYIKYTLTDVFGRMRGEGVIVLAGGTSECNVTLTVPGVGWYRVRFYDGADSASSEYCSVSVVLPGNSRKTADSPICIDLAGQFASWDGTKPVRKNWTDEERQAYARAMRLAGFGYVRERVSGEVTLSGYKGITKQTDALAVENMKILNTFGEGVDYSEDLYLTYSRAGNNATAFNGKIFAWEGKNEPDLKKTTVTPDMEASSFKASALGVLDSGTGAIKALSSVYEMTTEFVEEFMMNDVARYADCINIHNHTADWGGEYRHFPESLPMHASDIAVSYGGGKPIWCTEAGLQMFSGGEDGITPDGSQPLNARYAITSAVESLAEYGIYKHFYFIGRHFTERGNFGLFTSTHMPYASYNALSTLTNYLGKGKARGVVRDLPDGVKGYVFDAGDYDAAVLYTTGAAKEYVQFNTASDVTVIDVMGAEKNMRHTPKNKKVNIPVTIYPIIVKFDGHCDESNYYRREFAEYDDVNVTSVPDAQRIILRQRWQNTPIERSEYQMERGTVYTIKLDVCNLAQKRLKGTIVPDVTEGLELAGGGTVSYNVPAYSTQELEFRVKVKDGWTRSGRNFVSFGGTCGSAKISNSTAPVYVLDEGAEFNDTPLNNFKNNKKNVKSGEYTADSDGMYLKLSETGSGSVTVYTADKNGYYQTFGSDISGSDMYRLQWKENFRNKITGIKAAVNPEEIYRIKIDLSASVTENGRFSYAMPAGDEPGDIVISGIEDGKIYKDNKRLTLRAQIPSELSDINMYLNYEKVPDAVLDGDVMIKEFKDLAPGAYSVYVTGMGRFGKAYRSEVRFFVRNNRDYNAAGVFYR